jgi:cysteinyl-tRNA synthetase
VTLRLYDTAARTVREFQPVTPGRASVYLCGATVQAAPHLGHLRSAVCFDIVVRWLEASGYQVTYCRNVTDIDDKILRVAAAEDIPWWALAERSLRAFTDAYDALGCRPPDVQPRATGHIPEMIELIERLIAGGHAYQAGGDVYFDVRTDPAYGELSGQRLAEMRPTEEPETTAADTGTANPEAANPEAANTETANTEAALKRDPHDFVLWKGAKPGEPSWRTPWGPGRPGWHLECSAMSTRYLGPAFDIHGGGIDLIFPHHENERAQSTTAGDPFARYWLHHGLVVLSGRKVSKSEGRALAVAEALAQVRPQELRYYLGQAHYRSPLDYSQDALEEAVAAYQRIERFVSRAQHVVSSQQADPPPHAQQEPAAGAGAAAKATATAAEMLPISFAAAMDDDLGVPAALASVHAAVRDGNYALSTGDIESTGTCLTQARAMLTVLGLDPLDPVWRTSDPDGRLHSVVDSLVALVLRQRETARARGDYASADSIRDTLEDTGVAVDDTPEGPRWELKR